MRLTETEWQIMNALWKKHPATARELGERLPDDVHWAYTTVKTLLSRLVAKGAVGERKRGNVSVYEPLVSQSKARCSAVRALVDQAFGGAVEPFLGFLSVEKKLSARERRALEEMLRKEAARKES